jgi:poly-gamma-glutamate synthase PgsB/CapB
MKKLPRQLLDLLDSGIPPALSKIHVSRKKRIAQAFLAHRKSIQREPSLTQMTQLGIEMVQFLMHKLEAIESKIQHLHQLLDDFNYHYSRISTRKERQEQILHFSKELGADFWQLWGDRRAFSRWFGHDAITERCLRLIALQESDLIYVLSLIGALSEKVLSHTKDPNEQRIIWQQLNIETNMTRLLPYSGDNRVRLQAFKCLVMSIRVLDGQTRQKSISQNTLTFIYRSALESKEDTWIQVESLNLLQHVSLSTLETVIRERLSRTRGPDDIFVRRRCAELIGHVHLFVSQTGDLFDSASQDPSPYVRQGVAEAAVKTLHQRHNREAWQALTHLIIKDTVAQVRASALLSCVQLIDTHHYFKAVLTLWKKSLRQETNSFVLRTTIQALKMSAQQLAESASNLNDSLYTEIMPVLKDLHTSAHDICVRRWTAQAMEWLQVMTSPVLKPLFDLLQKELDTIPPGKSLKLHRKIYSHVEREDLYRVLSVIAQDDYGFTVQPSSRSMRIWRGDTYVLRVWRFLFELFHPSPYKRQGYTHTTGRILLGNVRIPSSILSELTQTNVPGEPLYIPQEDGWRPYLPLVDEVLSSLFLHAKSKPVHIYSSEGITVLKPPISLIKRLWAWGNLTTRFRYYAQLRNWTSRSNDQPNTYTVCLAKLGFTFSFHGYAYAHKDTSPKQGHSDPEVQRFFPSLLPLFSPDWWQSFQDYFFSVYGNTLYELGLFATAVLLIFVGRRVYLRLSGQKARKKLPLVIGGWGTRGKSGTERLKASIFEALGHSIISKTTGTEAMFLFAYPMGKTREMMLFRPYDKATIWEQYSLNRWAAQIGTDVVLWECMGLNPSYVSILQKHWCQDDYSTLTNAYPDHEDIQGPAGMNIPLVMTEFIPKKKTLITSEEQMRPVLREGAKKKKTRCQTVDWLEASMIPEDIIERFPYQEHPYNIALVLRLIQEFDIDKNFALKEMADRVIPDIGVLKAYPQATHSARRLEFINGMAANERYATLSNWERMGFASQTSEESPVTLQSVLVNNRADRVSRSQMFADIIVQDLSVDVIVLIGSNLTGLMGFIREAWDGFIKRLELDIIQSKKEAFTSLARHLRVPIEQSMVEQRLGGILEYLGIESGTANSLISLWQEPEQLRRELAEKGFSSHAQAIADHIQEYGLKHTEYTQLLKKLSDTVNTPSLQLHKEIHELVTKWFFRKIHIIENAHVSGESILQEFYDLTTPGLLHRVMGIQNIKGPGLDFVYRWQSWESCCQACKSLCSKDESQIRKGLRQLLAFQDFGLLCQEHVQETLSLVRTRPIAQSEQFQAGLDLIQKNLENRLHAIHVDLQSSSKKQRAFAPVFHFVEAFVDAGDGIRRSKKAKKIYRDLKTQRISHDRAVSELTQLHKRQKGGWLFDQFLGMFKKLFQAHHEKGHESGV